MTFTSDQIYQYLKAVKDPEVPVLDVVELGVVRKVECLDETVEIEITPTYTGCPALKVMEDDIIAELGRQGVKDVRVKTVLFPPWTTDWMSEDSRQKLRAYGIAPPGKVSEAENTMLTWVEKTIPCPFCDSEDTRLTSRFGSTACKALHTCNSCRQPFEHFKCL